MKELEQQITAYKENTQRIQDQQTEIENLLQQIQNQETEIGNLNRQIQNLQTQTQETHLQLAESQEQNQQKQTKLDKLKRMTKKLIDERNRVVNSVQEERSRLSHTRESIQITEKEIADTRLNILQRENQTLTNNIRKLEQTLESTIQNLEKQTQQDEELKQDNEKLRTIIIGLKESIQNQSLNENLLRDDIERYDKQLAVLESKIKSLQELTQLTEEEQRELRAINSMSIFEQNTPIETIIESGEIEAEEWRDRAKKYGIATVKGQMCLDAAYRLEFQLDYFRNLKGDIPVTMEARQMLQEVIDNSELARYTRFKIWAKENLLGLSAFAITTAGLITTLALGLKSGTTTVAKATWSLSKALAHVAARVAAIAGPIAASAFSILATILNWGARGIFFLANNLWLLGLLLLSALYSERKRRRARK